jgi:hypothetical protein
MVPGLIDDDAGLAFGNGLQFQAPIGGAGLTVVAGPVATLIADLQEAGVWPKLDLFYLPAVATSDEGVINLKSPGNFTLIPTGAPTFTPYQGFTGNGTSSYLATGFIPSVNAVQMTQNSASFGVWVRNNTTGTQFDIGSSASSVMRLNTRASSLFSGRLNTGATVTATLPANTSVGFTTCDRASAAEIYYYKNGVAVGPVASVSSGLEESQTFLLRDEALYSNRQIAAAFLGGSLTTGENAAFYTAMLAYMTAVGAA